MIKCLEMRAKIKSVRKNNEILFCIFTYIWKLDILSTYLNFIEKWVFVTLKAKYQNLPNYGNIKTPRDKYSADLYFKTQLIMKPCRL